MATPLNMPQVRKAAPKVVIPMTVRHSRCRDKGRCTGPGCKVRKGD